MLKESIDQYKVAKMSNSENLSTLYLAYEALVIQIQSIISSDPDSHPSRRRDCPAAGIFQFLTPPTFSFPSSSPSFQSFTGLTYSLPHTCFEDVILVPLATWVLLVLLAVLILPVYLSSRKSTSAGPKTPLQRYSFTSSSQVKANHLLEQSASSEEKVGATDLSAVSTQRTGFMTKFPKLGKALAILYFLLLLASLLMSECRFLLCLRYVARFS